MARRVFSSDIVESDAFLDMPLTSQALYMHLNMNADNDGFVNPKRILRMVGANDDDLRILIAKRFIILFDSGIAVIKHWWINNTKRHDRHVPTSYLNELSQLIQKDNKSYTQITTQLALVTEVKNSLATEWQPNDSERLPQCNATQPNATQFNSSQRMVAESQDLDKSKKLEVAKVASKKSYAIAMEREREQEKRVDESRSRKPVDNTKVETIKNNLATRFGKKRTV